MTKIQNKSILLLTNDITIIESIKSAFLDCNIIVFSKKDDLNKKYDCIIIDDFDNKDNILNIVLLNGNIINISANQYENVINLTRPFSLKKLYSSIIDCLSKNENILKFKDFELYNGSIKFNNIEVNFGNKENALIKYLYNYNYSSKYDILKNVWGYSEDMETRVLENTVNKIRTKFKMFNIGDFILFKDGKYSINNKYMN